MKLDDLGEGAAKPPRKQGNLPRLARRRYETCKKTRMPRADESPDRDFHVYKKFDIRAQHPLQLELRLDAFSEALGARGGRVLGISRYLRPEGEHLASVQYALPLRRAGAV